MEHYRLRRVLRFHATRNDPRRYPAAVIGKSRYQPRELQRRDTNLLPQRYRCNRDFRPAAHWLGQTARLARQLNPRLLSKPIRANVFVEAILAQPQGNLDRAYIA